MKRRLLLTTLSVLALSFPAYAEDGHGHTDDKAHAHESSGAHSDGHGHDDGKPHFSVARPDSTEAAWNLMNETIIAAQKAIETDDANVLHESGEKLEAAIEALHGFADKGNERLGQALGQLTKTVDRFHHAAEDNDKAGASESLSLLVSQKDLVKSLYQP
ncbi:hypothetical protein [Micavibrio aeruginosavorus]|nr:hypothetical protein [Micavibrio aeruginosavorus]